MPQYRILSIRRPLELLAISSIALSTAPALSAIANFRSLPATGGLYLLNLDTGNVSFCYNVQSSSNPPESLSPCTGIGSVGPSVSGFTVAVVGNNLYIVSKTTGVASHCVVAVFGLQPAGTCSSRGLFPL